MNGQATKSKNGSKSPASAGRTPRTAQISGNDHGVTLHDAHRCIGFPKDSERRLAIVGALEMQKAQRDDDPFSQGRKARIL